MQLDLDQRAFSYWSQRFDTWAVEAGEFIVDVGHHSRDLPLTTTMDIDAPPLRPPLTADSTLHEWTADPIGREVPAEAAAAGAPDPLPDAELVQVGHHADVHTGRLRADGSRPQHPGPPRSTVA